MWVGKGISDCMQTKILGQVDVSKNAYHMYLFKQPSLKFEKKEENFNLIIFQ